MTRPGGKARHFYPQGAQASPLIPLKQGISTLARNMQSTE